MLCVIFDLDGTLVDSEPLCSKAFLDLLPDLEDTVTGLMRRYTGLRMADVLSDLSSRLGRRLDGDFDRQYRRHLASLYDSHLTPMPGAVDALARLGYPMCVATNGPVAKMHHGLRVTGLSGFFGPNVFSAYEVGHWKPEPQLFLHAARTMGYAPECCVVLEDSEAGLAAGRAAGMHVVRFLHENTPGSVPGTDATIRHFREFQDVLRRIAQAGGRGE
jgi:HAD superfamily hydrolase (TIGR01509 family)